jgi:hypothetical protein
VQEVPRCHDRSLSQNFLQLLPVHHSSVNEIGDHLVYSRRVHGYESGFGACTNGGFDVGFASGDEENGISHATRQEKSVRCTRCPRDIRTRITSMMLQ